MEYRILGRTGLKVSIMGIGGGGPTQMGQKTGVDQAGRESIGAARAGSRYKFF